MPRQTHTGRVPFSSASRSSNQKATRKHKQRGLEAFSIATNEVAEKSKTRKHRLGEAEEGDQPERKRRRPGGGSDDEEDGADHDQDEGVNARRDSKRSKKLRDDDDNGGDDDDDDGLDNSGGSDSDGNEWRMGEVSDDEDEEVDSDEAFGESDEERFEGFTFRGSSSNKTRKRPQTKKFGGSLNLNEDDAASDLDDDNDDSDDDSLGDEAIDLAAALDQDSDESDADDNSEQSESESDADDGSESSYSDEEDGAESARLQKLQDIVSSLPRQAEASQEADEQNNQTSRDRLLGALQSMSNLDPAFTRSARKLAESASKTARNDKSSSLVKVPLPKRQQDRIDRTVAYTKAKETLNRWIDTVKHNRRAEHLMFPLKDPNAQEPQGTNRLVSASGAEVPRNDLEQAIQTILQESGLAATKGRQDEEEQIRQAEELQTRKLPIEEVMARRAELRKQRDLLFREEIRARRIKKIKSKAYRRVHRKEKEKLAQKEKDLFTTMGMDDSEEEREKNDRRRAEERMGARHRESKWAKGVKQSGRGMWDDEARSGITDMARRNEELRKRMEGQKVRGSDDESADFTSDESEEDGGEDGTEFKLRQNLEEVAVEQAHSKSGLSSIKFMQKADAARKKENDQAVANLRRTLDGDSEAESDLEPSDRPVGRRSFGPALSGALVAKPAAKHNDLEEGDLSESEEEHVVPTKQQDAERKPATRGVENKARTASKGGNGTNKSKQMAKSMQAVAQVSDDEQVDPIRPADLVRHAEAGPDSESWQSVQIADASSKPDSRANEANQEPGDERLLPSNEDLVRAAFGGDEDEAEFETEKAALTKIEDDKIINNALPGWGSWVGQGMSKAQQKRNKPRQNITREEGVKAANRKDAKLGRVIISEKRIKKNAKYLAATIPHPFESRQQYERSLRLPIGPEWTTKESFQTATKPRVMVKQGLIKPMQAPII